MTRTELIELVNQLTERKAESILSLPLLYQHVLQEFCGENRFWWRKRTVSFNTVVGQPQYDLTQVVTTPVLTDISIEETTRLSMVVNTTDLIELDPIFDDLTISEAIEDTGTTGPPNTYGFDATDWKTLRIMPIPDNVYKLRLVAWFMPNPATDSTSDAIPLVPPHLHRGIVHGMEKYIWRVVYGQEDPKTMTAQAAYDKAVAQAQIRPRFTTNYTSQLISQENSVQSTNNGSQW